MRLRINFKALIFVAMLTASICPVCYAEGKLNYTYESTLDGINVTGCVSDGKQTDILIRAIKYTDSIDINNVVYQEQKKTDEKGNFTFSFCLPSVSGQEGELKDFVPAKYVLSLGCLGSFQSIDSMPIEYYGKEFAYRVIQSINNVKATENDGVKLEQIKLILSDIYPKLLMKSETYDKFVCEMGVTDSVAQYLMKLPEISDNDTAALSEQLNESAVFAMINEMPVTESDKITDALTNETNKKYLGITGLAVNDTFDEFKVKCGDLIAQKLRNYGFLNKETFPSAFEYSVIASALSKSLTSSDVKQILNKNESLLNIQAINSLTDMEYLSMAGLDIADLSDVKTRISSIISSRKPASTGGSGGGGGGGSLGGVRTYPKLTDSEVVVESNDEENLDMNENSQLPFDDLDDYSWARRSIENLYKLGVINGTSEKKFDAGLDVKREEFVKMLVVMLGYATDDNAESNFNDVDKSAWYSKYIGAAQSKKIISGVSDDEFGVGCSITRQDAATIVYRISVSMGLEKNSELPNIIFDDSDSIADYSADGVGFLSSVGVINGYEDNKFYPKNTISRAEAAVLIDRFIKYMDTVRWSI